MTEAPRFICKPLAITQDKRLSFAEQDYLCLIWQLSQGVDCTASNGWFADYFQVAKPRVSEILSSLTRKKFISVELHQEGKQCIGRTITIIDEGIKKSLIGVLRNPLGGTKDLTEDRENKIENKYIYTLQNNSFWELPAGKAAEYRQTYPRLDVEGELLKARQWLIDNPDRRKTGRGMPRFLNHWLSNAKPAGLAPAAPQPVPSIEDQENTPGARALRERARQHLRIKNVG